MAFETNLKKEASVSDTSLLKECGICCENFNKSSRKPVSCSCGNTVCMSCCKSYLLELITEPKCMNCNKGWTVEFIVSNMSRSFYLKDLRWHLAHVMIQQEKSLLPAAYNEAKQRKKIILIEQRLIQAMVEFDEFRDIVNGVEKEYRTMLKDLNRDEDRFKLVKAEYIDYCQGLIPLKIEYLELKELNKNRTENRIEPTERRKFIMHCRTADCNGYLSARWKCELCEKYTCKDCLESIGTNNDHECLKENVESARLLKKETKGCPSCGIPIFKIAGCDQMWCVECHTPFSWKTQKISTGTIHNPHFFLWQNKERTAPRRTGDIPCGGLLNTVPLKTKSLSTEIFDILLNLLQGCAHISVVSMGQYEPIEDRIRFNLRVKFLTGEIDEDKWKKRLCTIQKTNSFRYCVYQVLAMYVATMVDLYRNLHEVSNTKLRDNKLLIAACSEIILLTRYAEKELDKINHIYKQVIPKLYSINKKTFLHQVKWAKNKK